MALSLSEKEPCREEFPARPACGSSDSSTPQGMPGTPLSPPQHVLPCLGDSTELALVRARYPKKGQDTYQDLHWQTPGVSLLNSHSFAGE